MTPAGRVGLLPVEADRAIPGRHVDAEIDDLIDDFAEAVILSGGEAVVVPAGRMSVGTVLAVTFRF